MKGSKRWIISPPAEALNGLFLFIWLFYPFCILHLHACIHVMPIVSGMELATEGAFFRHATFDWSDEESWPRLQGVKGINVVLREGCTRAYVFNLLV